MLKALFWKEWREQRPLVVAGLVLAALWPIFIAVWSASARGGRSLATLGGDLLFTNALILWPLLAVAAGASTIANEIGDRTLEFLLSRPVARTTVWAIKVLVAALSATLVVATGWILALLLGGFEGMTRALQGSASVALGYGAAVLLLFSFAVFFSTFLPRAMTAAAAGLGASAAVITVVVAVWSRLDLLPRLEPQWFATELLAISGAVLVASLFVFSRSETLRGRFTARSAAAAALFALFAAGIATIPIAYARMRLLPSGASLIAISMSPKGDAIVATATPKEDPAMPSSPEIWLLHPDAAGMTRLTGRLTFAPVFSPDGRSIAYLSSRSALGLRSDAVDLRIASVDGREDELVASELPIPRPWANFGIPALAFSPDGAQIAFVAGGAVEVARTDRARDIRRIPLSGARPSQVYLLGWASSEEILFIAYRSDDATASFEAVRTDTEKWRVVYDGEAPTYSLLAAERSGAMQTIPVVILPGGRGSEARRLALIDTATGRVEILTENGCHALPDVTDDGKRVAYATCSGSLGSDRRGTVHVRERAGGADRVIGSSDGEVVFLKASPSAESVLVRTRRMRDVAATDHVLDARGARDLGENVRFVGWAGRDRMVLAESTKESSFAADSVFVLSATTDQRLQIYP
ncbi:MAG: PD40 domain-containing protein [Acidobacteria bacterium]|nr:PD40 domain-containing protein [Acidobacteriota bacterium]